MAQLAVWFTGRCSDFSAFLQLFKENGIKMYGKKEVFFFHKILSNFAWNYWCGLSRWFSEKYSQEQLQRLFLCGARNPSRVALDKVEECTKPANIISLNWLLCSHEMEQRGNVKTKQKKIKKSPTTKKQVCQIMNWYKLLFLLCTILQFDLWSYGLSKEETNLKFCLSAIQIILLSTPKKDHFGGGIKSNKICCALQFPPAFSHCLFWCAI